MDKNFYFYLIFTCFFKKLDNYLLLTYWNVFYFFNYKTNKSYPSVILVYFLNHYER